jgi:hypothetical protein
MARRLRVAVVVVMVLLVAGYVAARFRITVGATHVEYHSPGVASDIGHAIATVAVLFLLVSLARLVQMLGLIGRGDLFSATVVRRFRGFAFWLLVSALCDLLGPIFAQLTMEAAGRTRHVRMVIDFREIIIVGTTLLLFLLARLLERAREIESENREIV